MAVMSRTGQTTRAKFTVILIDHDSNGFPVPNVLEVAKFYCKGDAISYAIWLAHTIPVGKTHVFEVYDGNRREYRAG